MVEVCLFGVSEFGGRGGGLRGVRGSCVLMDLWTERRSLLSLFYRGWIIIWAGDLCAFLFFYLQFRAHFFLLHCNAGIEITFQFIQECARVITFMGDSSALIPVSSSCPSSPFPFACSIVRRIDIDINININITLARSSVPP